MCKYFACNSLYELEFSKQEKETAAVQDFVTVLKITIEVVTYLFDDLKFC